MEESAHSDLMQELKRRVKVLSEINYEQIGRRESLGDFHFESLVE
jgi:hypothetical protein